MSIPNQDLRSALEIDLDGEAERVGQFIRTSLRKLKRRGLVVAISGGIDSACCAALAVRAIGRERVYGLMLPERDSSSAASTLGQSLVDALGIRAETFSIAGTLEAIGCYEARDQAIRSVVPDYGPDWQSKLVLTGGIEGGINHFELATRSPDGVERQYSLPLNVYLQIVAATNHKQRIRKTLEYYHADKLNYAVVGTPNLLEYDQGFFVKNGDGSADIKPIAHLYKTQVYALARHLMVPKAICDSEPTTDTYSMPQSQEEFYFALPYEKLDLALWAYNNAVPAATLAQNLNLTAEQAEWIYGDIEQKRRTAAYLHARALKIS